MQKLIDLRNNIDDIDTKILQLLTLRAEIALEIGKLKGKNSVLAPERETEILHKITANNKSLLADEDLLKIFKAIITANRNLQYKDS